MTTYFGALQKAGLKAGSTPSADQIAKLSKAAASFNTPKLQSAVQHLESWATSHCGGLTSTSP
jgi:hypothetical protein